MYKETANIGQDLIFICVKFPVAAGQHQFTAVSDSNSNVSNSPKSPNPPPHVVTGAVYYDWLVGSAATAAAAAATYYP